MTLRLNNDSPTTLTRYTGLTRTHKCSRVGLGINYPSSQIRGNVFNTYLVNGTRLITSYIGTVHSIISVPIAIGAHVNVSSRSDCRFLYSFVGAISNGNRYRVFVVRTHGT